MAKNMSFLPEDYLEKRIERRTNVIMMSLFVIVMIGVVAAFRVTDRQRQEVENLQAKVNGEFEEAARLLDQLDELQDQKKQMLRKAQITSVLVEQLPRSFLLAEMINHMPDLLSLIEFELDTKTIRSTRARTSIERNKQASKGIHKSNEEGDSDVPPIELKLDLKGMAPTDVEVAQFMSALNQHGLFSDINLQFIEEIAVEDQMMRKFRLDLKVNQKVDLSKIKPTMVQRTLKQNPMDQMMRIQSLPELFHNEVIPASNTASQ